MAESSIVAGYFRVSKARDGMSAPEIYTNEIERYCRYRSLELKRIFSDIDYSGWRDSRKRPALRDLLEQRHDFAAIIIPKLARFGRDVAHLAQLFELFDKEGIALVFLDLGLDTSSSQGRLLRNIMASIAEYESDVKSDYARANFRHVAGQGRPWGSSAPFGYHYDLATKNYVIFEPEAAVVREMFTRFAAGEALNALARDLERRGVGTRMGAKWRPETMRKLLDHPAHIGRRRFDGELIMATWPALIDDATWEVVQERRARQRAEAYRRGAVRKPNDPVYLLTGLMVCGGCGKNLVHKSDKRWSKGMHVCPDSGHFSRPCPGGGISSARAEEMILKAFRERFWFAFASDERQRHERLTNLETKWASATIEDRKEILGAVVARVELIPRSDGNRTGRGLPRGRQIRIVWADGWSQVDGLPPGSRVVPIHTPLVKYCRGCGLDKPLEDFQTDASRWDGKASRCRQCRKEIGARKRAGEPLGPLAPVPPRKPSYMREWKRFQEECERKRDAEREALRAEREASTAKPQQPEASRR